MSKNLLQTSKMNSNFFAYIVVLLQNSNFMNRKEVLKFLIFVLSFWSQTSIQAQTNQKTVIQKLNSTLNSKYNEFYPVISADGNTLFFTRSQHPQNSRVKNGRDLRKIYSPQMLKLITAQLGYGDQDIWMAKKSNGKFTKIIHPGFPLNNIDANTVCAITADENKIILINEYLPDGSVKGGFSYSVKTASGNWSFPEPLKIESYQPIGSYTSLNLSMNGQILLLSEGGYSGYGQNDLYVSYKKANGYWSKPKNIGPDINTSQVESNAFLAADMKTLYFVRMSKPFGGIGDIYVSKRLDNSWTKWTEPKKLDFPINSRFHDCYPYIDAEGEWLYFSSDRDGSRDIYRAKLEDIYQPDPVILVKGKIIDGVTKKPLSAEILLKNLDNNELVGELSSNPKDGKFKITLPIGAKYSLLGKKQNYIAEEKFVNAKNIKSEYAEKEVILELYPIKKGQRISLNTIFFYKSKVEFKPESFPELLKLVKILKDNPTIKIRIEGHTDSGGTTADKLLLLSQQRADAVKNYLVAHGIASSRLTTKGYGDTKPKYPNSNKTLKPLNRRVEFVIL